jgi:hypothetical protein
MAKAQQQLMVSNPQPNNPFAVSAIDPKDVSQLPLAQYYQMAGNFVNVQNAVYYDTAVYTAGTPITQNNKAALFTKGKTQDSNVVNTGVAIAEKGEFMTNMISDGEFEGGTTFLLEQVAVDFMLTSEQPTTLGTRGEITAPNYTASVVISAANHAKAIGDQFELQYLRNEEIKLRGLLKWFPSPFGYSGDFGSPNSGFIQNGYGIRWNMLSRVPVLQSEDKFSFVLQPIVPTWTPTISFNLRVCLIGKTIKTWVP